jgi:Na+-transporting NADH:ubiquinone oxidoreductase subunit C
VEHSSRYIVLFAAAVCAFCSIFVAGAAVSLKDRQERNKVLDVQKKVLALAELMEEGEKLSSEEIGRRFSDNIVARAVELETGSYAEEIDADNFDQRARAADTETSQEAPPNAAKVMRVPDHAIVYQVEADGEVESLILPIQGRGLWSTLYGFLALESDSRTIQGIVFYEHGETPGLGGEVDNPRWKALWKGRKAYDAKGSVAIEVKKGRAGPPDEDPYHVDGLSGATITSRGVSHTLDFWLGEDGFGDYLTLFRQERGI